MSSFILRFIEFTIDFLMSLLTIRNIQGLENLPDPPFIIAANHLGTLDVPLPYLALLKEKNIRPIGWTAEKYKNHPFYGPILRTGGSIFIQRGKVDRKAIGKAVEALHQGNVFGMAPEGTRSPTRAMIRAKTGVAYLADEANVPIVPAAITGTETVSESWLRFRRPVLTLQYGSPFMLPPVPPGDRSKTLRHNTDEIMCRIGAMLPYQYRGFYANYPRLKELLSESSSNA